eukprot:106221_1
MALSNLQWILTLNVLMWTLFMCTLGWFYLRNTTGEHAQKIKRIHEKREWVFILSLIFIVISLVLTLSYPNTFTFALTFKYYSIYYVGICIAFVGNLLLIWTLYHLGKMWSLFVSTMEDHILVQSGPYKFARHPMYTATITIYIGFFMSSCGWLILITLIFNMMITVSRFRQEERLMIIEFGDEYINYMKAVGAFCPLTSCDCGVNWETEPKVLLQTVQDNAVDPTHADDLCMEATDDHIVT